MWVSLNFFEGRVRPSEVRSAKKVQDASPTPASLAKFGSPPRIPAMIDREQVLHVARLARLRLSEEEVETMVGELSGILEHVDRIGKLDLEGVEPTSHVVALENVLRADEPHQSLPRELALEPAPEPVDGAFRVPSPQADA